jgi:hypothetical protein
MLLDLLMEQASCTYPMFMLMGYENLSFAFLGDQYIVIWIVFLRKGRIQNEKDRGDHQTV